MLGIVFVYYETQHFMILQNKRNWKIYSSNFPIPSLINILRIYINSLTIH